MGFLLCLSAKGTGHMPTPREGSMPIHIRHSYPHKSIHAMYYNLACICRR